MSNGLCRRGFGAALAILAVQATAPAQAKDDADQKYSIPPAG